MWRYRVRTDHITEFEKAYGPDGPWVELFQRHPGYVRTELLRDIEQPGWYLTIDSWRSKEECDAFRHQFRSEFEALDAECERLTEEEISLGEFSRVS